MQNINTLYDLLVRWVQVSHDEYIRENPAAVFLIISVEGQGFIGDDAGGIHFEFDTIRDGIARLKKSIELG